MTTEEKKVRAELSFIKKNGYRKMMQDILIKLKGNGTPLSRVHVSKCFSSGLVSQLIPIETKKRVISAAYKVCEDKGHILVPQKQRAINLDEE